MDEIEAAPVKIFHLAYVNQPNDANELLTGLRLMLPPMTKLYLVPSRNEIWLRATAEDTVRAEALIREFDKPKKQFRLLYTVTELEGGKRLGVQHFSVLSSTSMRTTMKNGSKVPVVTGSLTSGSGSGTTDQFTYLDVGISIDATLDEFGDGGRLKSKVEQLTVVPGDGGGTMKDPVLRQTLIDGFVYLTLGKASVLGTVDVVGSTRQMEVAVTMEPVR